MKNMFITVLEEKFDEFFKIRNPLANLSDPHTNSDYREELEKFAQFLVDEYEQSITDADYWGHRFLRNED